MLQRKDESIERHVRQIRVMRRDRVAMADFDLRGRTIRNRDRVVLVLGTGNRDPARFYAPDAFILHSLPPCLLPSQAHKKRRSSADPTPLLLSEIHKLSVHARTPAAPAVRS